MSQANTYTFTLKDGSRYDHDSEITLPRVSTILGVLGKPQLIPYTYKVTLEGIAAGLDRLADEPGFATEFLNQAWETFSDPELLDEWLRGSKLHPDDILDDAAERGQKAHRLLAGLSDLYRGAGPDAAMSYAARYANARDPYQRGVANFWVENDPRPILSEKVVYNLEQGYAGRLDMVAALPLDPALGDESPTVVTLLDLKTRREDLGVYDSDDLQTIAYRKALEFMRLSTEEEIADRRILLANDEGTYKLGRTQLPDKAWDALVALYWAKRRGGYNY